MEIKGPGRIATVSRKGKKRRAAATGFGPSLLSEAAAAASSSGTSPLTEVSSLLSLQEMPNESDDRTRGLATADSLLGHLEIIRHGLLAGQIPYSKLKAAVTIVSQQRSLSNDPALDKILADIDLRIRVELAKLEMLGDTSGR